MITLITGALGGGKTSVAVRMMIEHMAKGLTTYGNVDLDWSECVTYARTVHKVELQRGQFRKLPDKEDVKGWVDFIDWGTEQNPVLVVIDEAHSFWDSRDWQKTQKEEGGTLSFLTHSRKAGTDLMFITQEATNLDKKFRNMAQFQLHCRKLAHLVIPLTNIHLANVFRYRLYEIMQEKMRGDLEIKNWFWSAYGQRKRLYDCYRTEAMLDSFMSDLADKKEILDRRQLRPTTFVRRWAAILADGDFLERRVSDYLRKIAAKQLHQWRTKNPYVPRKPKMLKYETYLTGCGPFGRGLLRVPGSKEIRQVS